MNGVHFNNMINYVSLIKIYGRNIQQFSRDSCWHKQNTNETKLKIWKDLTNMQSWTIRNINVFYLETIDDKFQNVELMTQSESLNHVLVTSFGTLGSMDRGSWKRAANQDTHTTHHLHTQVTHILYHITHTITTHHSHTQVIYTLYYITQTTHNTPLTHTMYTQAYTTHHM